MQPKPIPPPPAAPAVFEPGSLAARLMASGHAAMADELAAGVKGTRAERRAALAARNLPDGGPSWLELATASAREEGADVDDVIDGARTKAATRARHRAWLVLRAAKVSYPKIAAGWFVHHTTVMDGVRVAAGGPRRAFGCSRRAS